MYIRNNENGHLLTEDSAFCAGDEHPSCATSYPQHYPECVSHRHNTGFPLNLENENGHEKVMEFCDQSWKYTNFAPTFTKFVFFVTTKTLTSNLESLHFPTFSRKMVQMQNWEERWSWKIKKWSWESNGAIMEKYFVKYVRTL